MHLPMSQVKTTQEMMLIDKFWNERCEVSWSLDANLVIQNMIVQLIVVLWMLLFYVTFASAEDA
jgi:hypothetical protein